MRMRMLEGGRTAKLAAAEGGYEEDASSDHRLNVADVKQIGA